jgi:hypothetical protein
MRRADLTESAFRAAMSPWQDGRVVDGEGREFSIPRLYERRFLDAFMRTPPWTPYVVAGPIAVAGLAWGLGAGVSSVGDGFALAGAFVFGGLLWSLVEYLLHRFVFHARVKSETGRIAVFLAHGHHHVAPQDRMRIAATPVQMGSAMLLLFGICDLCLDGDLLALSFAGSLSSYVAYEAVHYIAHHGQPRSRLLRALRRHHLAHHHVDPHSRWGIGTPLWDVVLGTKGAAPREDEGQGGA